MCCSGCGSSQLGSFCWIFIQTHWPLLPFSVLWTAWPKSLQAHILAPSLIGNHMHYALDTPAWAIDCHMKIPKALDAMYYPTVKKKVVKFSVSYGKDFSHAMSVSWCRASGLVAAQAANPPIALCRMWRWACRSHIPHLQDAKAGSCHNHVSAAECSSGSLSIRCLRCILSRLGKFPLLGVCAGPHFCGSDQQRRLPGQQPVCGAGVDQGAVPGRFRLPCRPQCRWAILQGVQDTTPCPVLTPWLPPLCLVSESHFTSPGCLNASSRHSRMPSVCLTEALTFLYPCQCGKPPCAS